MGQTPARRSQLRSFHPAWPPLRLGRKSVVQKRPAQTRHGDNLTLHGVQGLKAADLEEQVPRYDPAPRVYNRGWRIHCRVCMRPELSLGDPEQRVFSANDASPKWNHPSERHGWALKQKGQSAAYIQSDVCAPNHCSVSQQVATALTFKYRIVPIAPSFARPSLNGNEICL